MSRLRIAACQLNTVVGDLEGNVRRICSALGEADKAEADLAVFPELAVTGYPPEDLLLKPGFVADNMRALERVAAATGDCAAIVGFVDVGLDLHNAAAVCASGRVHGLYHKRHLPNYSVFDEQRYFAPGERTLELYEIGGLKVGVSICEDAWTPSGPIAELAAGGAELIVNLNASPYYVGRLTERASMLSTWAGDASCPLVYVNQVGGQDELVFDGGSLVLDAEGRIVASSAQFVEEVTIVDLDVRPAFRKRLLDPRDRRYGAPLPSVEVTSRPSRGEEWRWVGRASGLSTEEEMYRALVLGTRDYVSKNGFSDVLIGLSGGVDSSLVGAIAVDALGAEHVHGVAMPSRFSSESSLSDASALGRNLGIDLRSIPIEPAHASMLEMLDLGDSSQGLTGENLQSRIRGVIMMALSNATGWIVLTTGNKSELATGYSTLYGDTAGGFAVIKDVPKTAVYHLCEFRNERAGRDLIPDSVLKKAPSAELRLDQRDDQSLPPYEVLDPILAAYVEADMTAAELEEAGFDTELTRQVVSLVDAAEYKRRQTPLGVRLTPKAFGKDRRMPITNRYRSARRDPQP